MLFVYMLEGNPAFEGQIRRLGEQLSARGDRLCTSLFTVGEVLTGPYKKRLAKAADKINQYFRSGAVELLPYTLDTSERYAQFRAAFSVKQADAIHLATASVAGVDLFVTNDQQLLKLHVPGVRFMMGLDGRIW